MKFFKYNFFIVFFFWVTIFVSQENELQHILTSDGLPSATINDIIQDEIGYLWMATGKGLVRFDGENFKHYSYQKKAKATTLFLKNDSLFIGFKNGLLLKKGNKTSFFESKEVLKIITVKHQIYVATKQGIYKLKGDYLQPIQINTKLDFSIIYDILFDGKSIYVASNKGLWKVDTLQNLGNATQLLSDKVTSLLLVDKKILVGTSLNGIKVIENGMITNSIRTEKGISQLSAFNNEIWISTNENGIEILNTTNFSFKRKINKYNTLETNKINTVYKDNQQNIWITTHKFGLYKYNPKNSVLESEGSQKNKLKPTIYLKDISVNYEEVDSISINNYPKILQLNSNQNNISIAFKTVDINHPKHIQYRYKLFDKFSPWSKSNSIDFGNLAPGNYTFNVQSRNRNFEESNFKTFSFFIDTPVYKKPWFSWAVSGVGILILSGILLFSIQRIKKRNRRKVEKLTLENHLLTLEQKALQLQMNPHFIFNVLNGIKALGNNGNTKELNETISQFATLLRSVLYNSRQVEITLEQEVKTIKNYIELEQKMSLNSFSYKVTNSLNNIDPDEILIPPMLLQPFVENAIKHAFLPKTENGIISIYFSVKSNYLHCTVIDNGIGFRQSKKGKSKQKHKSLALEVTKERIINLSTKFAFTIEEIIKENKVQGTKVWFSIPLKTDY